MLILAVVLIGCKTERQSVDPETVVAAPPAVSLPKGHSKQEDLLLTFAEAYPDKITDVEFIDDDWTMMVNGVRFYFANGRFLPEDLREDWKKYLPYDFYVYPWTGTNEQRQAAYRNPVYSIGSSFLFDTLYGSPNEDDSWELQVKYSFMGVKMLIHRDIKPALDNVAAIVLEAAKTDPSINKWKAELQTGLGNYGWSWRVIAHTSRRSNHSYGTAVDLLPVDLRGRHTYWEWDRRSTTNYYLPPAAVIKAFEANGFIWGGKWDLIDTMHFEYRPEILLLNGFSVDLN